MTREEAILLAAAIAAAASLLNLALTALAARGGELRAAQRATLEPIVTELASLLYEIVALSQAYLGTTSPDKQGALKTKLSAKSERLDEIRRQTRYTLWGLSDGVHTLLWLPRWAAHTRGDSPRSAELVKRATALRKALDQAVRRAYLSGRPPGILRRWIVDHRANEVKRFFGESGPPVDSEGS